MFSFMAENSILRRSLGPKSARLTTDRESKTIKTLKNYLYGRRNWDGIRPVLAAPGERVLTTSAPADPLFNGKKSRAKTS
jgi:hypothetical protein